MKRPKAKVIPLHPKGTNCEWEKLVTHLANRMKCLIAGKPIPDPPKLDICDGHIADLADAMGIETSYLIGDLCDRVNRRTP